MTRGNQREMDRAKAQKKAAAANKNKKNEGTSFAKRQESDAEIMRAKQAAKAAKDASASGSGTQK